MAIINLITGNKYTESLPDIFYQYPYINLYIRRKKLQLFKDITTNNNKFKELSNDTQVKLYTNIEKNCYNSAIIKSKEKNFIPTWESEKFCNIYNTICYRVSESLDNTSNLKSNFLINLIIANPNSIKHIGSMKSEELCPYNNIKIRDKIKLRLKQKIKRKTTSMYKCNNCNKNKAIISRVQIRSQDEGTSTMCYCVFCSNIWIYL